MDQQNLCIDELNSAQQGGRSSKIKGTLSNVENFMSNSKAWTTAVVLVFSLIACFYELPAGTLDNHESFVALSAREMIQSGNYSLPTNNGEPRLKKTPLQYWLVAGIAKITGKVDAFSARFPSAISAFLVSALLLYFVSKFISWPAAVVASLLWSSSVGCFLYARNARPEMPLAFFCTLAMLSFFAALNETDRKKQVLFAAIFWIAFGFGNLAKGPVPFALVLPPIAAYLLMFKQWSKLKNLLPIAGPVLCLLILLPWPAWVMATVPNVVEIWKHETVDRYTGDFAGGQPIYFYLPILFHFTLPWIAFMAFGIAAPFFKVFKQESRTMFYFWLWFAVEVLILTISGGKRKHYLLPAIPALAVLAGIVLDDIIFRAQKIDRGQARVLLWGHAVIFVLLGVAGPIAAYFFARPQWHYVLIPCSIFVALTGLATLLYRMELKKFALGIVLAAWLGLLCPLQYMVVVQYDKDLAERQSAMNLRQRLGDEKLCAYRDLSAEFIYYYGKTIPFTKDPAEALDWYNQGGNVLVENQRLDTFGAGLNTKFDMPRFRKTTKRTVPAVILQKGAGKTETLE